LIEAVDGALSFEKHLRWSSAKEMLAVLSGSRRTSVSAEAAPERLDRPADRTLSRANVTASTPVRPQAGTGRKMRWAAGSVLSALAVGVGYALLSSVADDQVISASAQTSAPSANLPLPAVERRSLGRAFSSARRHDEGRAPGVREARQPGNNAAPGMPQAQEASVVSDRETIATAVKQEPTKSRPERRPKTAATAEPIEQDLLDVWE
jgi:hypothetical protein